MSVVEFELPEDLKGLTYEKILADMLAEVDKKYDKSEGGFVFDMIAPSALEAAELTQFWLALGLKTNFHMWATGRWLDYHASDCGLERRSGTFAYGDLTVKTTKTVTFPAGFIFSVPSENGNPAIEFETLAENVVNGTKTFRVKAVQSGVIGNVPADSITIMKNPVKNVESITNSVAFTGGTEPESDDSLRQRIDDFYAGRGASFVGNKADYERWAKEVAGVGYAHCIPLYAGANSVKLVICDANGDGAAPEILLAVEQHIFGTGHNDLNRLAPIGVAQYEVAAPTPIDINLKLNAKIAEGYTKSLVKKNIVAALKTYFKSLSDAENIFGVLYYVKVSAILSEVAGLEDFKHLRINDSMDNVVFNQDEMPTIELNNVTLLDY